MTDNEQNHDSQTNDHQDANVYATSRDWAEYFEAIEGREPRETVLEAIRLFDADPGDSIRFAVDLGCGEGRDSAALLRAKWKVHAIDGHPDGIRRLLARNDLGAPKNLSTQLAPFESVELPECDLLNASFSLPFCNPDHFDRLWSQIVRSIRSGGRFSGQLFGNRDTWASIADRSHHTKHQVEQYLLPFEVELLKEEEREGQDCNGIEKHWHLYHIVARKL